MNRWITRHVTRLVLLAILVATIVACGNTPLPGTGASPTTAPATDGAAAEATTAPAPAEEEEPTEAAESVAPPPDPTPVVREAAAGRETVIEVWYPFGGETVKLLDELWAAYEAENPDVGIKAVFAANDLSTNAKLFTAIAAGTGPDVTFVDGPQVAEWAARGALEPLDELIAANDIKREDWWAPCWDGNVYNGKTWAMVYNCVGVFGFFWNKAVFKDAGLDPEKAPATIAELDAINDKLTKLEGDRVERLGLIPWTVYGSSNSMFTWGWAFGGEFFDPETNKVTANHPKNVQALQWMVDYANKHDPTKVSGFVAGFGAGEQNPFYQGQIGMTLFGPWEIASLKQYAPDLEYGMALLPTAYGGAPGDAGWAGGWTVGIPKGAKQTEAAFKFIQWLTMSDFATDKNFQTFPGYKNAPFYTRVQNDPELKVFYDILVASKHVRPVMPAQAFYTGALQRAVDAAIFGQKTPQQALDDATKETQAELDRILKEGVQ